MEKVVRDPERDSFIDVIVKPAAHLDRLDEVLVITSTQPRFSPEQQQDLATSEALKGAEAAAIKDQMKASEIMAERLPGLIDPNLPPDQQPLHGQLESQSRRTPAPGSASDRFTPGAAKAGTDSAKPDATTGPARDQQSQRPVVRKASPLPGLT